MVQLIKKPEEILEKRLSRRGYNMEDCRKMLRNAGGGVVVFNKRSLRNCSLKDYVDVKNC